MIRFAATIFISAFLLFLVQPMIGKFILPWFGGGSGVWTACLLFFQAMLLAGYAYAHVVATRCSPRLQMWVHVGLLAIAAAFLPILPHDSFKPEDAARPVWRIVVLLIVTIGLPYLALAATGPLIQAWFARSVPDRSPYRLYALSNLGSLLALLGYPFLLEPAISRTVQAYAWSGGFLVFALLCAWCAVSQSKRIGPVREIESTISTARGHQSSDGDRGRDGFELAMWIVLPMCASIMLLAATSQISEEIAPMPFVWVLPLSIYLISFIVAFEWPRLYDRRVFVGLAIGAPWLFLAVLIDTHAGIIWQAMLYLAVLFICCMICHGELYRLRPSPHRLTGYYLAIALGGALGGGFVSIVAPAIFSFNLEIHLSLFGTIALLGVCLVRDARSPFFKGSNRPAWLAMVLVVTLAAFLISQAVSSQHKNAVVKLRSFYGSLIVREIYDLGRNTGFRKLFHGRICHGSQSLRESERYLPLMYYSPSSGVGIVMRTFATQQPRRIGVVGLGAGAMAAWAMPGDHMRFYEINPQIVRVAREQFTFLQDCRGTTEVILGDARLAMEREEPQQYDVMVLDAFSGDAVPTHLLTREAFAVYRRHLRDGGVIAVNVTNRYLELHPVVHRLAIDADMQAALVLTIARNPEYVSDSHWMILSSDQPYLESGELASANALPAGVPGVSLWTDNYCSIFEVLRH